jgi:hypothetical protein
LSRHCRSRLIWRWPGQRLVLLLGIEKVRLQTRPLLDVPFETISLNRSEIICHVAGMRPEDRGPKG